jgi:hypothetical protein
MGNRRSADMEHKPDMGADEAESKRQSQLGSSRFSLGFGDWSSQLASGKRSWHPAAVQMHSAVQLT